MTCKANAMVTRNRLDRHEAVAATDLIAPTDSASNEWTIRVTLEADQEVAQTSLLEVIVCRNAAVADVSPQGNHLVANIRA